MLDRNKNKLKIEINKALQTVNNILKPTAEARQALELAHRELASDKPDRLHGILRVKQTRWLILLSSRNLFFPSTTETHDLATIAHLTPIDTTLQAPKKHQCLPLSSEIWKKRVTCYSASMLVCTTARRVAFPTSMFLRVRKD
jgi:hypothetical protein